MTPDEFAQHLTTQPWALDYIHNLVVNEGDIISESYILSAFTWRKTAQGDAFWRDVQETQLYNMNDNEVSRRELLLIISTYFPNNPELFI